MKGLIVFDDKSDLAFFSLDREMEKHVFNRMKQLSGTSVSLLNWKHFRNYMLIYATVY